MSANPAASEHRAALLVEAKRQYDAAPSRAHCPSWDQLGDVTKQVWVERVIAEAAKQGT